MENSQTSSDRSSRSLSLSITSFCRKNVSITQQQRLENSSHIILLFYILHQPLHDTNSQCTSEDNETCTRSSGYFSLHSLHIHIMYLCTLVREIYNTHPCTYIGVIFGFFLLNIVFNCLWKRDQLMLKVKILLVNAEELFMVFPDSYEEATPGMATNMYSLLLQWTTGLNAAAP